MLVNFPLLVVPLIVYNLFAFTGGVEPFSWGQETFVLTMVSGTTWVMTYGDLIVTGALVLLFIEVLKATRTGASSIVDHLLSTLVFIAFLIEFLLISEAATSTFFILMAMALFDVLAGFSVTISAARRDFGVGPSAQL
ncbi:MAG: hypothetical protein AAGD23_01975 [Pseudomonadota bacterium]